MRALFLSDWSSGNPYQELLAGGLAAQGVAVVRERSGGRQPVSQPMKRHGYPDILHVHWSTPLLVRPGLSGTLLRSGLSWVDLLRLKRAGVKIVWTVHNLVDHEQRHPRIEGFMNRRLARLCDGLIVHFPAAEPMVREAFGLPASARIAVIPHGHYIDSYPNTISRAASRERLSLSPEQRALLFFGAVRPYKGLTELLEAFHRLEQEDAVLLIAGRPNTRQSLEIKAFIESWAARDARIRARLEFIPDEEVQLYMNAADAVALPFKDVFTSGSAILAMSFGKAIIAPRLPHLRFLLDGGGGALYDPQQASGLSDALAVACRSDLGQMGERNRQFVRQFSWDLVGQQTAELYAQALGVEGASLRSGPQSMEQTLTSGRS